MTAVGTEATAPDLTRPPRGAAAPPRGGAAPRRGRRRRGWLAHLPLAIVAIVTAFPFYVMVVLSLRSGSISLPGALIPDGISFDAYAEAVRSQNMPRWILNTVVYAVVSVVLVLWLASMAGYAFAKKRFFGKEAIFWTFIAMLMVPYHLTLIPQFILVSEMGGLNTYWGLIVPTLANAQAMFLMRQFIQGIPDELIEAARIDGAGEFRIYWQIVLPQTKPVLATLGVFVFLWHWNDFLWPLVAARTPENFVLTVGLFSLQKQESSLAVTMAAAVLTFLPTLLVFMALQKYFVRGITMSGLKG